MYSHTLKKLYAAVGLDPSKYTGHSLRKRGASCAFLAGCDASLVKMQGDWVSNAYQRYVTISQQQKAEVPVRIVASLLDADYLERCATLAMASRQRYT
jgi:hypothetical protein